MLRSRDFSYAIALTLSSGIASAQTSWKIANAPDASTWIPDGPVEVIEPRGDRVYVGGNFSAWGPATGSFATVDSTSGALVGGWPATNGEIRAIAPDGVGGWFLAGTFDRVGAATRNGLAHVLASGQLDAWAPIVDGDVRALTIVGGELVIAGSFVLVNGQARGSLAAFDASLQLKPWNPGAGTTIASFEGIDALATYGGDLFASGFFNTTFSGHARKNFVAIDVATGAIEPLNPAPDGAVRTLVVAGSTLWLGGNFQQVFASPRQRLAAIDLTTGSLDPLTIGANRDVFALSFEGSTLFVGGAFDLLGGLPRVGCGSIDVASATVNAFAPIPSDSGNEQLEIRALLAQGGAVYLGGNFREIGGEARWYCGAVDSGTGAVTSFTANVAGPAPTRVRAIANDGTRVAIAGAFVSVGAVKRHGVAALDADTFELLPWAPQIDSGITPGASGPVRAIAFDGNSVYVAGGFGFVDGVARARIAVVDATTGALDPTFDAGLPQNADGIANLAVLTDGILCDDATLRDRVTGSPIAGWTTATSAPPKRTVRTHDGSRVIFGGSFTELGIAGDSPVPAKNLAAVDAQTGAPYPGYLEADKPVLAMSVDKGRILVAGEFDSVGGVLRRRIAEIDTDSNALTMFAPVIAGPGSSRVSAVAQTPGMVFCGGSFATVQSVPILNLAAMNRATSAALNWGPTPNGEVLALAVVRDRIVVGGSFGTFAAGPRPHFAAFRIETLTATPPAISIASGGSSDLKLVAGAALAGKSHWIVGSATGTQVGFELIGSHVPLDLDAYTLYGFGNPVNPFVPGGFGALDSLGRAAAKLILPPGGPPSLVGVTLWHAGVVYDPLLGKPLFVSNPAAITLHP